MVSRELVDHLMLGTQQDFAELSVVEREQGGADLFGFDFVKLGFGDFFGRDAELAGGEVAVLVGVDAVEERGDEFACLLYTSPSPRDRQKSRMPSSA